MPDRDAYLSTLASDMMAKGHLRTDTAPADAPYSAADLARSFAEIAFSYEFYFRGNRVINEPLDVPLRRWEAPIRYRFEGDAVTADDRAQVAALTDRLARLTGLAFHEVEGDANMLITIATARGRKRVSRSLGARGRHAYRVRYDRWRRTPSWICGATMSTTQAAPHVLVDAHIFLGAELTGVMRTSCLHEEIVQALGLTDDTPHARPSILNDDQEFALFTDHDARLLQVLYDARLRPGMSRDEAMPIARRLFAATLSADVSGTDAPAAAD